MGKQNSLLVYFCQNFIIWHFLTNAKQKKKENKYIFLPIPYFSLPPQDIQINVLQIADAVSGNFIFNMILKFLSQSSQKCNVNYKQPACFFFINFTNICWWIFTLALLLEQVELYREDFLSQQKTNCHNFLKCKSYLTFRNGFT